MAVITLHPSIKSIHGRIGNIILYNVNGSQYARSYTKPFNPRTARQQKNRSAFAEAVKQWQHLSPEEKNIYNNIAKNKKTKGYNLFISISMKCTASGHIQRQPCVQLQSISLAAPVLKGITSVALPILPASGNFSDYSEAVNSNSLNKRPPGDCYFAA